MQGNTTEKSFFLFAFHVWETTETFFEVGYREKAKITLGKVTLPPPPLKNVPVPPLVVFDVKKLEICIQGYFLGEAQTCLKVFLKPMDVYTTIFEWYPY